MEQPGGQERAMDRSHDDASTVLAASMDLERIPAALAAIPCGGHTSDGLLWEPTAAGQRPAVLRLHGLLGNVLDETEHFLPRRLAAAGYASLTMTTTLANLGLFFGFGLFSDSLVKVRAGCEFLRQRGYRHIVVAGHGVGGCMAIRYAAALPETEAAVLGVAAIASPYSLPETVRRRWERFGSQPTYDEMSRRAEAVVRGDPPPAADEMIAVDRAHGETLRPEHTEVYTLRTWWGLAGPEADDARPHRHIGAVRVPILLVHGERDTVIEPRPGEDLGAVARAAGNARVTQVVLDADHVFTNQHEALGQTVVAWLDSLGRDGNG
jgi:pimeloyl-ACP methyl ester carboxylesterase